METLKRLKPPTILSQMDETSGLPTVIIRSHTNVGNDKQSDYIGKPD